MGRGATGYLPRNTLKKIMIDREETITAPDGKEYPIRDNE